MLSEQAKRDAIYEMHHMGHSRSEISKALKYHYNSI
jgi:hypothetical protein